MPETAMNKNSQLFSRISNIGTPRSLCPVKAISRHPSLPECLTKSYLRFCVFSFDGTHGPGGFFRYRYGCSAVTKVSIDFNSSWHKMNTSFIKGETMAGYIFLTFQIEVCK